MDNHDPPVLNMNLAVTSETNHPAMEKKGVVEESHSDEHESTTRVLRNRSYVISPQKRDLSLRQRPRPSSRALDVSQQQLEGTSLISLPTRTRNTPRHPLKGIDKKSTHSAKRTRDLRNHPSKSIGKKSTRRPRDSPQKSPKRVRRESTPPEENTSVAEEDEETPVLFNSTIARCFPLAGLNVLKWRKDKELGLTNEEEEPPIVVGGRQFSFDYINSLPDSYLGDP